jgi:ABC-type polysaccharide/polyol phosphate export permease
MSTHIYDSQSRRSPIVVELTELVRYRSLLHLMIVNEMKVRYKRSTIGVLWTVLVPVLNTAVLAFAFSKTFSASTANYPLYVLAGMVFWSFFSQTTLASMRTLVWGGSLLKRVYIPRTIYATAAVGSGILNLVITLLPILVVMIAAGHPLSLSLLFLPVALLLGAMFVLGLSLVLSTLAARFADVTHVYQVVLQAWFFLTPIIYPVEALPADYVPYLSLNPLYPMLELFRAPIYAGTLPAGSLVAEAACAAVFSLIAGWLLFTKKADDLAYRI